MPKEPSIIGIMTINYVLGIIILLDNLILLYPIILIWLSLATLSFLLQLSTISYIQNNFRLKNYYNSIKGLGLNLIPFIIAIINGRIEILYSLLIKSSILTVLLFLNYVRGPNDISTYLIGTALITTTLTDTVGFLGVFNIEIFLIWIYIMIYYVSTSYYVESRLTFRDVPPYKPLILWIIPAIIVAILNKALILSVFEPTIKHLWNTVKNIKLRRVNDIRWMGRLELIRSIIFTALIVIGIYTL